MVAVIATIVGTTFPSANALIQRDWSYGYNDNQMTARYGNTKVCGDHMCAPGEWDQLQSKITAAQLGYQGGRNTTQTTTPYTPSTVPSTPTPTATPTQMQAGVTGHLCDSVKTVLDGSGVSSSVISQVMSDLGCS